MRPQGLWEARIEPFFEKYFSVLCVCVIGIACARLISTYGALSLTVDEPAHLACGLEYLAKHIYRLETQHPPLSRALQALGPYFAGSRPVGLPDIDDEGMAILARSGNVDRTVFLMRLGNLPFFLLASLVVCWWSWHAFGKAVAVVATGLFTLLPTMLADGGLATTDMALGATVGAAFFAAITWAEKPTWFRGLVMGLCTALSCLSKFTALGYIPVSACLALGSYVAIRRPTWREVLAFTQQRALTFVLAVITAVLLIWAGYWFSFGKILGGRFSVPAPEFFDGILNALHHNRRGHEAFLLGQFRTMGWWYYFPVALLLKTPIAFLMLFTLGAFVCFKERAHPAYLLPLSLSLGILLPAIRSHVDIGIRHIEPIYIGLSVVSALGLRQLLQWARTSVVAVLTAGSLVVWLALSVALYHPDYLAYFNKFAGGSPETILVDSNYDWGQDLKLLAKRLRFLGVKEISLASLDGVMRHDYLERWYGLPTIKDVDTCTPSLGWTVVSPTFAKSFRFHRYGINMPEPWYERVAPTERVGTLRLYNISPAELLADTCH